MQAVVQKLPLALTQWRENVVKIRCKDGEVAGFAELVEFLEYAAESANDPVYGKTTDKRPSTEQQRVPTLQA